MKARILFLTVVVVAVEAEEVAVVGECLATIHTVSLAKRLLAGVTTERTSEEAKIMTIVDSEAEVVGVAAAEEDTVVVAATMTIVEEEVIVVVIGKKTGTGPLLRGDIKRSTEEEEGGEAVEAMAAIDSIVATVVGTVVETATALRPVLVDHTVGLLLWLR